VTPAGQLVVAPLSFDETKFVELEEPNTAYNFYGPRPDSQFVMTGFIAKADKQVSSTVDATVIIYEADSESTTTVDKTLFQVAMVEGDLVIPTPINILVRPGKYINAKTDDDDIHMTVIGYFIPIKQQ
jgi:hypothetical protein